MKARTTARYRAPDVGVRNDTKGIHTAHKTENRRVHYQWHPFSGRDVVVHGQVQRSHGLLLKCQLDARDERDRLEVPAWMFDPAVCASMTLRAEPYADAASLRALRLLLNECAASGRERPLDTDSPEVAGHCAHAEADQATETISAGESVSPGSAGTTMASDPRRDTTGGHEASRSNVRRTSRSWKEPQRGRRR